MLAFFDARNGEMGGCTRCNHFGGSVDADGRQGRGLKCPTNPASSANVVSPRGKLRTGGSGDTTCPLFRGSHPWASWAAGAARTSPIARQRASWPVGATRSIRRYLRTGRNAPVRGY